MKNGFFAFFVFGFFSQICYSQKQICTTIIPEKVTSFDTSGFRGLADNYYLWNNGQKIYVRFISGSKSIQDKIISIAKEWEKYANIHFVFLTTGNSNIRINLDSKGGHNSLIGTLANSVNQNLKTMNLDTTDFDDTSIRRIVLHEFGHALGLLHEHFNPLSGISWNKENVYKSLSISNGWDSATVDANIFEEYSISYTNGTVYDQYSIMHYPILRDWTTNNFAVDWNNQLSNGDKSLIAALYPVHGNRSKEVPRFQITSLKPIEIINSKNRRGLLIYPRFTITTSGKEGTIYFIIFFYYQNGDPIILEGTKYNINKIAATFKSATIPPNLKLHVNSGKHDLELYIPYSVFPLPEGTNTIQAKFNVVLYDNDEIKMLSSSNPINCIIQKW